MKFILELALQEITTIFGHPFVSFLLTNTPTRGPRPTLSADMPWAERSFMIRAIDDIADETLREGARIAHLAMFGSRSWEEEQDTVYAKLLA